MRNATEVQKARLRGQRDTGGKAEALLLGPGREPGLWRALVKTKARLRPGLKFRFGSQSSGGEERPVLDAEVLGVAADGEVELRMDPDRDPYQAGEIPIPPYIRDGRADPEDADRYQTHFAKEPGSVAAPTAGLHFDPGLDAALEDAGVAVAELVLHIGVGTFRPLRREDMESGELHEEHFVLPEATVAAVAAARRSGGRLVAVGTTSCRVLESQVADDGQLRSGEGSTRLFLRPGDDFRVVDGLLTNFHLPRSSLLLLVAAFAGREALLGAYREAIAEGYRFYSYGDAMLIL